MPATPANSLICRKCGYDLRQTPLGGVCPECATPIISVRYRVENGVLIVSDGAILPPRCIKTNLPTDRPQKTVKVDYVHPAIYLLLFAGLLPLLIVYLLVRKQISITFSLSREAINARWIKAAIAGGLWIFCTFGCCVGTTIDKPII